MKNNSYVFLTVGQTQESKEATTFKRYIGIASSFIMGVNPNKAELEKIRGFAPNEEPQYIKDTENGKEVRVSFITKTDPETNNGIEIFNNLNFTLRLAPNFNRDKTKVQVIDKYGNHSWGDVETVKAGGALLSSSGKTLKLDTKYRMAMVGEADLVDFLKLYLGIEDAFEYKNGVWAKKSNADSFVFSLDSIKEYFKGDFKELRDAIKLQPNNKVKLLYGVRTTDDNKQYQMVASRGDLMLRNNAGSNAYSRLEENLKAAKANGSYATTEFKVGDLEEYTVTPTDFSTLTTDAANDLPFGEPSDPWNTSF